MADQGPLGMVDGPNVYAYVVNNPVTMVDATGKSAWNSFLGWFGGRRGDLFDRMAEFVGRCVGVPSVLLLLGAWIYLPIVLVSCNGIGGFGLGSASVATVYPAFATKYSIGLMGGAYVLDVFDILDWPFSSYTDFLMGDNPTYSCADVLKNVFGLNDQQVKEQLDQVACNA